jgi:hypothetical protein
MNRKIHSPVVSTIDLHGRSVSSPNKADETAAINRPVGLDKDAISAVLAAAFEESARSHKEGVDRRHEVNASPASLID